MNQHIGKITICFLFILLESCSQKKPENIKKIQTQNKIYEVKEEIYSERHYITIPFEKLFGISKDTLLKIFDSYLIGHKGLHIEIGIDSLKKIKYTKTDIDSLFKPKFEQWLQNLEFPYVVFNQRKDTLKSYRTELTLVCPEIYYKKILLDSLNKIDEKILSRNDSAFYENEWGILTKKLFKKNTIYAFIQLPEYMTIYCFIRQNKKWKETGKIIRQSIVIDSPLYTYFEDLDGDGIEEVIWETGFNMNGNSFREIGKYNKKSNSFAYAGSFCCRNEIDKLKKEITQTHYGSWWMPAHKTLYRWKNNKLFRVKEAILELKELDIKNKDRIFTYYENPFFNQGKDTLVLVTKELENEKIQLIWDNFFKKK